MILEDKIIWANVNIEGSAALIEVRELVPPKVDDTYKSPCNIVADHEGLLISLKVYTRLLGGSNVELVLDSAFESREALEGYQNHPAHVKAATEVVRPRVKNRRCADYEA